MFLFIHTVIGGEYNGTADASREYGSIAFAHNALTVS